MNNLPANIDQNAIVRAIGGIGDVAKEGGRVALIVITGNKFEISNTKKGGVSSMLFGMFVIALFVWIGINIPTAP